jgi:hypothetical protein
MKNRTLILTCMVFMLVIVAVVTRSLAQKPDDGLSASASAVVNAAPDDEDTAVRDPWEYLVVAGGNTTNLSSSGSSSMRKEPKVQAFRENFVLEQNLDKLGAQGWELISVSGQPGDPVYYFKRRK